MPLRYNTTSRAKRTLPVKGSNTTWRETVSRELEKGKRLFVLGIGNRRKGDDAAGSLCIGLLEKEMERKKRRPEAIAVISGRPLPTLRKGAARGVRVLDAGETPEGATGLIRKFRPTHVLIVDAAVGNHQPGTIFVINKEEIRQDDISTHRLPLYHLVRYLEESIGCRVILVGIEPKETAWGKPVSAAVRTAAACLSAWLAETLMTHRP